MNKLLVALIAGGFVTVAAAQTAAPVAAPTAPMAPDTTKAEMRKDKAKAVESATMGQTDNTTGARATATKGAMDTAASKKLPKESKAMKQADVKATTAKAVDATSRSTAEEQKANTAISKQVPKEKVNLGTPAAEKEMAKKATP